MIKMIINDPIMHTSYIYIIIFIVSFYKTVKPNEF